MLKYQKFQAPISKRDELSKNDQMLWFMQKPNETLLSFVIILLWEVIYFHFYNWDRPLNLVPIAYDLVPIAYDLIELIIEASLWSKDYSIFGTHPQHTRLCPNNAYLICEIVLFKCDVYAQVLADQAQNDFWVFYMFFESDFILSCF